MTLISDLESYHESYTDLSGACPGFLKGGGGPISLGSLKKGHQILKGGVQWSDGGGGGGKVH